MNKRLFKLLSFVFLLALALPLAAKSALLRPQAQEILRAPLKRLSQPLQTLELKTVLASHSKRLTRQICMSFAMTWDISANANVEPGDYFDVTLPNEMAQLILRLPLTSRCSSRRVLAVAHVTPERWIW